MLEFRRPDLDQVFQALSDPTRRSMIGYLAMGDRTVSELAAPFDITLAAASKHIKVLEKARLIRREVRGRVHTCSLETAPLAEARNWVSFYQPFWTDGLNARQSVVEGDGATQARLNGSSGD